MRRQGFCLNQFKFEHNSDLSQVENWAQLQIYDTGQGIESTFLPYVFERFRQADGNIRLGTTIGVVSKQTE